MMLTDNNALKQRPVVQSLVFTLDLSGFTKCGDERRSGWASDHTSRSAVLQCSRIGDLPAIVTKWTKLSRISKIGTSKVHVLCMKNSNKLEARSMIFIIICLFS